MFINNLKRSNVIYMFYWRSYKDSCLFPPHPPGITAKAREYYSWMHYVANIYIIKYKKNYFCSMLFDIKKIHIKGVFY